MTGMHSKTFFRLSLKVIGVLLVVWNAPSVLFSVIHVMTYPDTGQYAYYTTSPAQWGMTGPMASYVDIAIGFFFYHGGAILTCAIGLYLFFGGEALVNLALPPGRPRCPECGYELASKEVVRCSECGEFLKKPEPANQSDT